MLGVAAARFAPFQCVDRKRPAVAVWRRQDRRFQIGAQVVPQPRQVVDPAFVVRRVARETPESRTAQPNSGSRRCCAGSGRTGGAKVARAGRQQRDRSGQHCASAIAKQRSASAPGAAHTPPQCPHLHRSAAFRHLDRARNQLDLLLAPRCSAGCPRNGPVSSAIRREPRARAGERNRRTPVQDADDQQPALGCGKPPRRVAGRNRRPRRHRRACSRNLPISSMMTSTPPGLWQRRSCQRFEGVSRRRRRFPSRPC